MENNSDFIFKPFEEQLQQLNPQVREKAVVIAHKLITKEKRSPEDAMKEGIRRAEAWFYDLEG